MENFWKFEIHKMRKWRHHENQVDPDLKKIENEEKRKEHLEKNQRERLEGAIQRILNFKDN